MSRWFRHYAGMMRDEKLVAVAIRSKQPVERVVWIWGAILESASEIDDGGRFEVDPAEVAYFLRSDESDVVPVFQALAAAGRVADGIVVKWGDRQYQSDKSADRQARYRERKQGKNRDGDVRQSSSDVTPPSRDALLTPQETDTELETESKKAPPSPPEGEGRAMLAEFKQAYPVSNHTVDAKTGRQWSKLAPTEWPVAISQARALRVQTEADRQKRRRSAEAHAEFVPAADAWLRDGKWRNAPSAPEPIPTTRLDRERDAQLWAACERVMGKPAPTADMTWAFQNSIIEEARRTAA